MKTCHRMLVSIVVLAAFCSIAFAQTNPNLETGFKPYGAYDDTATDSVNVANGNLTLHIPLFEYPQRGALKEPVRLIYNSKGWQVHFDCTQLSCVAWWDWMTYPPNPFGVQLLSDPGTINTILGTFKLPGGTVWTFSGQMSDGAIHQFAPANTGGWRSIDATGMYFNDPAGVNGYANGNYVMLDRAGNGYNNGLSNNIMWQDTSGNYFSTFSGWHGFPFWTDTLERVS